MRVNSWLDSALTRPSLKRQPMISISGSNLGYIIRVSMPRVLCFEPMSTMFAPCTSSFYHISCMAAYIKRESNFYTSLKQEVTVMSQRLTKKNDSKSIAAWLKTLWPQESNSLRWPLGFFLFQNGIWTQLSNIHSSTTFTKLHRLLSFQFHCDVKSRIGNEHYHWSKDEKYIKCYSVISDRNLFICFENRELKTSR